MNLHTVQDEMTPLKEQNSQRHGTDQELQGIGKIWLQQEAF